MVERENICEGRMKKRGAEDEMTEEGRWQERRMRIRRYGRKK